MKLLDLERDKRVVIFWALTSLQYLFVMWIMFFVGDYFTDPPEESFKNSLVGLTCFVTWLTISTPISYLLIDKFKI